MLCRIRPSASGLSASHEPDARAVVKREGQIDQAFVHHRRERSFGQPRRDRGREVTSRGALRARDGWSRLEA